MTRSFSSSAPLDIRQVDPRDPIAQRCLTSYYNELAQVFEGGFEVGRSRDPAADQMRPPQGAFLVAFAGERPVGCVGLKGTGLGYGEIKRLWVAPAARGTGAGRRLMDAAEATARSLGMPVLRLDTNRALRAAKELYLATGWTEIDRFNDDPYAHYFFEKRLG